MLELNVLPVSGSPYWYYAYLILKTILKQSLNSFYRVSDYIVFDGLCTANIIVLYRKSLTLS